MTKRVLPWMIALLAAAVSSRAAETPPSPVAPGTVARFALWEARISADRVPPARNPFDPASIRVDAEITQPSKQTVTLPAFWYVGYARSRDEAGRERLAATGTPAWCLRFTPVETGVHVVVVRARRGDDPPVAVATLRFTATDPPAGAGFVRRHPRLPGRLQFDAGAGYFALGHNVCWVKRENGTYAFDDYFRKMSAAGENYTRVWLCTWGLSLETKTPYLFDNEDAWRLDHVLDEARRRGICVMLCLSNYYDFRNHFDQSPFAKDNGGPVGEKADFFRLPAARKQYQALLRYVAARYGAYTSLLAWELWNEMNYALQPWDLYGNEGWLTSAEVAAKYLVPWTQHMTAALRGLDAHGHLITTSLGNRVHWSGLWDDPAIDLAQYHTYVHYSSYFRDPVERDMAALVLQGTAAVAGHGKPYLLSEFGYLGPDNTSPLNDEDPRGLALHNGLWAGALSGAAGTPMVWWWDNYIDPQNLYGHYKALAAFLAPVDWNEPFAPMVAADDTVRVVALRGTATHLLWIQNRQSTWHRRLVRKLAPGRLEGITLTLRHFPPGRYTLEWVDTATGAVRQTDTRDASDGSLRFTVPAFETDIALRAVRVRAAGNEETP